jgi:hypothetical protein
MDEARKLRSNEAKMQREEKDLTQRSQRKSSEDTEKKEQASRLGAALPELFDLLF